jgi:ketopantoate reductase
MVIVGAGRIGTSLHQASTDLGIATTLVRRNEGWDALKAGPGTPVLLAVRNDDLDDVLSKIPQYRHSDLVFIQNGAVRSYLEDRGLAQKTTRGLLYFAVKSIGGPIEPGQASPFTGPNEDQMVAWLSQLGLDAVTVDWARFSAFELEKMIWNSAFGLLCETEDLPVGQIVAHRRDELARLTEELNSVGRAALNVDLPLDWLVTRLSDYSMTIADYQGSVKEWKWFVAQARKFHRDTPFHDELLAKIGRNT